MKKITFTLSFSLLLLLGFTAGAQQARYYYYPASNVYMDPVKQIYIYPNGSTWSRVSTLPNSYNIKGAQQKRIAQKIALSWGGL